MALERISDRMMMRGKIFTTLRNTVDTTITVDDAIDEIEKLFEAQIPAIIEAERERVFGKESIEVMAIWFYRWHSEKLRMRHNWRHERRVVKARYRKIAEEIIVALKSELLGKGDEGEDDDIIEDGFGGSWSAWCPECGQKTMHIVRPGKVQCGNCE